MAEAPSVENGERRRCPGCSAIQCADCYPHWGERYNEALQGRALRSLVSDWHANGNSRPLGDPTAATWHECALQLLRVLDGATALEAADARVAEAWDEGVDAAFRGAVMRENAGNVKARNPHRTRVFPPGEGQ